jgi:hypothetical protein
VRPWWALGVLSLWFGACLNPMPEEFPIEDDRGEGNGAPATGSPPDNPGYSGAGTGSLGSEPEPSGGGGGVATPGQGAAGTGEPDAGAAPADAGREVGDGDD